MKVALFQTVRIFFQVVNIILVIRILLSWIPMGKNFFTSLIYNLTEPLLYPIRELLKKSPLGQGMMIDFSPIILALILSVIERILYSLMLS